MTELTVVGIYMYPSSLTLGVHVQRGLWYLFCVTIHMSV